MNLQDFLNLKVDGGPWFVIQIVRDDKIVKSWNSCDSEHNEMVEVYKNYKIVLWELQGGSIRIVCSNF